jgi:hypothetical protein
MRIVTGLSAVLCLAATGMWVRSYWARDGVWYSTPEVRYGVHSYQGEVLLWRLTVAPNVKAMTWSSPARMDAGFVRDVTPTRWYDQFYGSPMAVGLRDEFFVAPLNGGSVDLGAAGFRYVRNDQWYPRAQLMIDYPKARSSAVYVPWWAVTAVAGVLPAMGIKRRVRARYRRTHGLCAACGYDLRASSGACPECGGLLAG